MRLPMKYPWQNAIAAFIAVALFAPVMWMALDRSPPFVVTNGRIDPPRPMVNSSITVTWDVKSTKSCQPSSNSTVTRSIIDSKGIAHKYSPVHATYGTPEQERRNKDEIRRIVLLPENITGPAKYTSVACYACNPIQELWPICVQMPELAFEIDAEPPK